MPSRTKKLEATPHCLGQLRNRCGIIAINSDQLCGLVQNEGRMLYRGANGDAILIRAHNRLAVVVKAKGKLVTSITLEHAFANCPRACFLVLMSAGEMVPALNMRTLYVKGHLPKAHGTDDGNYKYPKQRAQAIWDVFTWSDSAP
jgi:hypothetical protein